MNQYTDVYIQTLINDPKEFPETWPRIFRIVSLGRMEQKSIEVDSLHGYKFRVVARKSKIDENNFSILLLHLISDSNRQIPLMRCDGSDHKHTNAIERNSLVKVCHVHRATERYVQQFGIRKIDGYAEIENSYTEIEGAFRYFMNIANITFPQISPRPLIYWC